MGLLEDELQEFKQLCERVVDSSKLVTCVPAMVRVEINLTRFKAIVICIQFPADYPARPLLLELKSKTLSERLLQGLTEICETKTKDMIGKPHIMKTVKFIHGYISENPLCCCYDELNRIKTVLNGNGTVKLKQKLSTICVDIASGRYEFKMRILVPEDYPEKAIDIAEHTSNFPSVFTRYLLGQARELARRCVEPPLRKMPPNNKSNSNVKKFEARPSLQPAIVFVVETVLRFPKELCPVCEVQCLPDDPEDAIKDEKDGRHVERVLCGHLYHQGCLYRYLRAPPFPPGGKLCPAPVVTSSTSSPSPGSDAAVTRRCDERVHHERWGVAPRRAEQQWAHKEARRRELDEVKDFLQ